MQFHTKRAKVGDNSSIGLAFGFVFTTRTCKFLNFLEHKLILVDQCRFIFRLRIEDGGSERSSCATSAVLSRVISFRTSLRYIRGVTDRFWKMCWCFHEMAVVLALACRHIFIFVLLRYLLTNNSTIK